MSKAEIMAELEAFEHGRETYRRNGEWDKYQKVCEHLQHLGRKLELMRIQERQEAK